MSEPAERFDSDFDMVFQQQRDTEEKEQRIVYLIIKAHREKISKSEALELANLYGLDVRLVS